MKPCAKRIFLLFLSLALLLSACGALPGGLVAAVGRWCRDAYGK